MPMIYEPSGRAREYSALACNVYGGCDHRCVYCYAPIALKRTREAYATPNLRKDFLNCVWRDAAKMQAAGITGRVLLSFTTDPYQKFDAEHCVTRQTIKVLHRNGLPVQVLTKGGSRALRDLDMFGPGDAFASTLTFVNDADSLKWEPGAALPADRIGTIRKFHDAGIETWASLEPVIDPAQTLELIRRTAGFVDLYKVGTLNYMGSKTDWRSFGISAVTLLENLGKRFYVKRDLAKHLPEKYRDMPQP